MEKQFDEEKALRDMLSGKKDGTRHIVGKAVYYRHCGQRKLRVQEIQHMVHPNGNLELNKLNGRLLYCVKCGHLSDNYVE